MLLRRSDGAILMGAAPVSSLRRKSAPLLPCERIMHHHQTVERVVLLRLLIIEALPRKLDQHRRALLTNWLGCNAQLECQGATGRLLKVSTEHGPADASRRNRVLGKKALEVRLLDHQHVALRGRSVRLETVVAEKDALSKAAEARLFEQNLLRVVLRQEGLLGTVQPAHGCLAVQLAEHLDLAIEQEVQRVGHRILAEDDLTQRHR